ncbi:UvrD-helicase domain-containing protein [Candidatus Woesearchaeota archaeon]|nr:UvrD-helicase domain-containing protein [Candidatus Woesearchaeota archaeon]
MDSDTDYLFVLRALSEIPFGVGKKLLVDFLQGRSNASIQKNGLEKKDSFGSMAYDNEELEQIVDRLVLNGLVRIASVPQNRFWKVLELTPKGKAEIENPSLFKRKLSFNIKNSKTAITDDDRRTFAAFGDFLTRFNDGQKKAIISNASQLLCIAGAGSGKTTVLTKRIEFLVNYRSVNPSKILAITFTRKARQEMMSRMGDIGVHVETFNSFCERMLRRHSTIAYDRSVRVIKYGEKISIVSQAVKSQGIGMGAAIETYFSYSQRRGKTDEQLMNVFVNDCFFLRDYFKSKGREVNFENMLSTDEKASMMIGVSGFIEAFMRKNGLRDFSDQLLDALRLFASRPDLVPHFDHVLVDEYQDVNSTQIRLLDVLSPPNIFCVGDPRQSIYGWRGSDVKHILSFEDKYTESEVVTLTKNYRSTSHIVDLSNECIRCMGVPDLESFVGGNKDMRILKFDTESGEFEFVIQSILASNTPRSEIFILARTNRQLNELSKIMRFREISHVVRSDEVRRSVVGGPSDVTLATVHAIKGMEADSVFVIGCNGMNFPCRGSEHPVMELVDIDEYDKEEEERRLFYVAMSRARKSLYMTYTGKRPTPFMNSAMNEMMGGDSSIVSGLNASNVEVKVSKGSSDVVSRLKDWRSRLSKETKVPAFIIMHDSTLLDIAQRMPMTKDDLNEVRGLGPVKVMRYGEDILSVVNC